jgi:hypothetical protein
MHKHRLPNIVRTESSLTSFHLCILPDLLPGLRPNLQNVYLSAGKGVLSWLVWQLAEDGGFYASLVKRHLPVTHRCTLSVHFVPSCLIEGGEREALRETLNIS